LGAKTGAHHGVTVYVSAPQNHGAIQKPSFLRIVLPAASPAIFNGMRVGIGTAFIVVIVSEMIAVQNGLGFRILEAREYMWSDKILAGMLAIGLLGLGIDTVLSQITKRLLSWHRGVGH